MKPFFQTFNDKNPDPWKISPRAAVRPEDGREMDKDWKKNLNGQI